MATGKITWCQVQNDWHGITQTYQNDWNNTVNDYKAAWNDEVHFAQQAQETIQRGASAGFSVAHIIIGVVIAVAVGVGSYLAWHYTHQWTRPGWADLEANENVPHQRAVSGGRIIPSSQHVLKEHVYRNNNDLQKRALRIHGDVSAFYDVETAQWTVDYALEHMNTAQKKQLAFMEANPMAGGQLVLTGTMSVDIGHGFKYNNATRTTTYVAATRTYVIRIAVDVNTGEPFIITAYPTL
ncbi:MAG: RNase A-like domain-containing protein [Ktedonobacteraceae bacterium]